MVASEGSPAQSLWDPEDDEPWDGECESPAQHPATVRTESSWDPDVFVVHIGDDVAVRSGALGATESGSTVSWDPDPVVSGAPPDSVLPEPRLPAAAEHLLASLDSRATASPLSTSCPQRENLHTMQAKVSNTPGRDTTPQVTLADLASITCCETLDDREGRRLLGDALGLIQNEQDQIHRSMNHLVTVVNRQIQHHQKRVESHLDRQQHILTGIVDLSLFNDGGNEPPASTMAADAILEEPPDRYFGPGVVQRRKSSYNSVARKSSLGRRSTDSRISTLDSSVFRRTTRLTQNDTSDPAIFLRASEKDFDAGAYSEHRFGRSSVSEEVTAIMAQKIFSDHRHTRRSIRLSHAEKIKESIHVAYTKAKSATVREDLSKLFQMQPSNAGSYVTFLNTPTTRNSIVSVENNSNRCRFCELVVDSNAFHVVIFLVICMNAVTIAIESDYGVNNSFVDFDARARGSMSGTVIPNWLATADVVFNSIFGVEVCLRIVAKQAAFFVGQGWQWNIFDLLVVSSAMTEAILATARNLPGSGLRVLRLLRLSRSIRTVRLVRFAPTLYPLRLLLVTCKSSFAALMWSSTLLFVVIWLFGILFANATRDYVENATFTDTSVETLREHFETLSMAMLTLFLCFLGEADFKGVIDVLLEVSIWYCVLFVTFVLFVTLSITNIIAGIFVSDSLEMAQQDREIRQRGELMRARKNMEVLEQLFRELDRHGCGQLTQTTFAKRMQSPDVQALFSYFKFDIVDPDAFFKLLDVDRNGVVDIEEFTVGCLRMHGKSNAIDMDIAIQEIKTTVKRSNTEIDRLQDGWQRMQAVLTSIVQKLESLEGTFGSGEHKLSAVE